MRRVCTALALCRPAQRITGPPSNTAVAVYTHAPTPAMVVRWCHALNVESAAAYSQPTPRLYVVRFHGDGDVDDAAPLSTPACRLTVLHVDALSLRLFLARGVDRFKLHDLPAAIAWTAFAAHRELHAVAFLWILEQDVGWQARRAARRRTWTEDPRLLPAGSS